MMTQERPGDALTVLEAAAKYRVNPETVRRWAREGRISAKKVRNMIFVYPNQVQESSRYEEETNG